MQFTILSHAGLLIRGSGISLVTDPWITGSCYWRSWWNYPPVAESLIEGLRPDFIYLTHIHWDHFHGVSLRRFPRNTPILVPRMHSGRIRRDLVRLGFRDVREMGHAESLLLAPDFRITSYHVSPFLDSALVVESEGTTLLNANDAKLMGGPLRHLLRRHPRIDFVLRSHSSANSRLSYEIAEDPAGPVDDLAGYIRSFAVFAQATRAKHAIPFASNHCYLHRDVFHLNDTIQTPRMVQDYFRDHGISEPRVTIMLSGDSWSDKDGFRLSPATMEFFDRRAEHLERYLQEKTPTLEKFYAVESRSRVGEREARDYFSDFFAAVPWAVRVLYRRRPLRFLLTAGDVVQVLEVDLHRRTVRELTGTPPPQDEPLEIHTSTFIFRQCLALDLFSHLAISKRVRYRVSRRSRRYMVLFNLLFNLYEYDYLPLRALFSPGLVRDWGRRWREVFLYLRIAADWLFRRRRQEAEYIALGALSRADQISFSNQSPAAER